MTLYAELKRRKVVRVAVVYAATGFVVLQAADIMLPRLAVPEWAMILIVRLVVLGFTVALVLAWALEVTPDGVRRTATRSQTDAIEPAPSLLGRRTVATAALWVVLVLEGSVRRAGDRVRITAQLIEADQGYHLWSELLTIVRRHEEALHACTHGLTLDPLAPVAHHQQGEASAH